jgi:restriction system protein
VKWIGELQRQDIDSDLRFSLGGAATVFSITRNNAEQRFKLKLSGKGSISKTSLPHDTAAEDEGQEFFDPEGLALDQIRARLNARFKGHKLAELVAAILETQGFKTKTSPPGPDGGVDVIAGKGELGFDSPRVIVQVKSEQNPVDVRVARELSGVVSQYDADHGLLVAWGGFKHTVDREMAREFFKIRLWSGEELMTEFLNRYELLPETIRSEVPLRRIWTLIPEAE